MNRFNFGLLGLLFLLTFSTGCVAYDRVEQGYTGLLVDDYGTDRGSADAIDEVFGRVWYNPITHTMYQNPNFVQFSIWDGESGEAVQVLSQDQLEFTLEVQLSWLINAESGCSTQLFRTYRKPADVLADTELKAIVRDQIQRVFSQYRADFIAGNGRNQIADAIDSAIREGLSGITSDSGKSCFLVEDFRLIKIDPPISVKRAATARAEAVQNAARKQEELQSAIFQAQADSIRAAQEAENNIVVSRSVTPELIRYRIAEGMASGKIQLPRVMGGNGMSMIMSGDMIK